MQKLAAYSLVALLTAGPLPAPTFAQGGRSYGQTATPIKHLVVIFQENVSFDHYFATYPYAANLRGEPRFTAKPGTPAVNGLTGTLLTSNPNATNAVNATGATNPFRLDRSQASTADQDHDYTPEQMAFDRGLMDAFPASVGTAGPPPPNSPISATTGLTMGYFDGNTVTALWNYAQRYAMSDDSFGTNFGPSTDGAVNLISGTLNGVITDLNPGGSTISDGNGGLTLISDSDPVGDVCSTTTGEQVQFSSKNIGDLLNEKGITWGFFEGGFNLQTVNANKTTGCKRSTLSTVTSTTKADYIPHHQPFQYYESTRNENHTRPTSVHTIGQPGDAANHQYDIQDFFNAVSAGNFPAVSYLKAPGYQDGHAGYSDPLDEQNFIVNTINFLQKQRDWDSTAVVIAYDDSDGWYDHQMGPIVNQSATTADMVNGQPSCGTGAGALSGVNPNTAHAQGRCGYGPRLVLMVISPWARRNFVDHTVTDQTSILRFVEDNWLGGERLGQGSFDALANPLNNMFDFANESNAGAYILDPGTGLVRQDQSGLGSGFGFGW
ncbi:MAG TPA: alkaline phosphatase family protein [Terracidiphilus sp.]|jgi:phospholipase C|nr:alkaline phosphatase family protein [Terracidiphilus sp.]